MNSLNKTLAVENTQVRERILIGLQAACIFVWLSNLRNTNAYFSVYVLCALGALLCLVDNHRSHRTLSGKAFWSAGLLSVVFALLVTMANYPIFHMVRDPKVVSPSANHLMNILECIATILGGIPVAYQGLKCLYGRLCEQNPAVFKRISGKKPVVFFFAVFGSMVVIDVIYLFFVDYPGNVSHDSIYHILQLKSGSYQNFLPYWYTRLIGVVMAVGYSIFGEINRTVAFYSVCQILVMTAIFAYTLVTMYQRKISWVWIAGLYAFYALMPYNIAYATSMWKDVMFGGFMLLMLVSQYRLIKSMGHKWGNIALMVIGGIGVCIMRTNGWYVMLVSLLILLFCGKEIRRTIALWTGIAVAVGFFLNVPMLKILEVPGVVKTETMSLPIQQIARVIVQDRDISDEDLALVDELVPVENIPEMYKDWTSDDLKAFIRVNTSDYLMEHAGEYISLWLRLGAQYPMDYLEAWTELTKGYWNGGYDYYIYAEYVADNPYGIEMDQSMNPIKALVKAYFAFTRETFLFEPLLSIGLQVWILIALCWACGLRKRKETVLCIPLLVTMAGLWVGAPVFSEFRYIYPIAVCLPMFMSAASLPEAEK